MRKRMLGFFALVVLCLAMVGCGSVTQEDYRPNFTGVWELDSMVSDGEQTSGDEIELVKAFGMNVFLILDEDGSCKLNLFGRELYTGTWEATSASEGSLKLTDEDDTSMSGDLTMADDKLTMSSESNSITFVKTTQEDMEAFLADSGSLSDLLDSEEE